jgi:hypothetical protein
MERLGRFEVEMGVEILDMIKLRGQADRAREASPGD